MFELSAKEIFERKTASFKQEDNFSSLPRTLDFFAGSGLVSEALKGIFSTVWANDICRKKRDVFVANHSCNVFHLDSIENISGGSLPAHELSWASFPCQDLSVAGNQNGINANRSGMVWQWLRVLDEVKKRPPVVVAENVLGLITSEKGKNYLALHNALMERGYRVGAVLLDAVHWLPHSRPRIFVIGVQSNINVESITRKDAIWCHNDALRKVAKIAKDWLWWDLPMPAQRNFSIDSIIEFDVPVDSGAKAERNLGLISKEHLYKMHEYIKFGQRVFPGYKRMRKGKQVLELRFDGVAGCLRTPSGGSSRQYVVIYDGNNFGIRLLTVRETARLMGADDDFILPGSYNDGYRAMGDAVAVPVARYLARELLAKVTKRQDYPA